MVHYIKGDLLKSDCVYICHQVNCQGAMNSGIAKSIRERWQSVYDSYKMIACPAKKGSIQLVWVQGNIRSLQCVVNMFSQESYGYDGYKYTSYDAFWDCLTQLSKTAPKGTKIGFPDHIGCCRGGGNWEVIRTMIEEVLGKDYEVYIYKLED